MLSLVGVYKEFDFRPVLSDVHLRLEAGASYALAAPNGSGKTTLLHIMCGLTRPTSGHVLWQDKPWGPSARRRFGVVLQQSFLYGDLTGLENLTLYARLYGCAKPKDLAEAWVHSVGLEEANDVKVKEYSKGMKQRLALARAMLHEPDILLLDEPFDGLDAQSVGQFHQHLSKQVERGATLFLVTHHEDEARAVQHRLTLRHGRLVHAG